MNECYICQAEAVSRCFTCGQLICAEHGDDNCHPCDTAVVAGDPRAFNVSAAPLRIKEVHRGWWRPQPAEAFEPPACYACKGLSRRVCRNCQSHYCREHSGPSDLCAECGQSARLGFWVLVVALGTMLALIVLGGLING
jgi:hypothetical protein